MMDERIKNSPCKECSDGAEAQLHKEVEHLRQHLAERDVHFVALEAEFFKCTARANDLEDQVSTWREKHERLYDSHKKVQKLNQVLEEKLLQMVDKMKSEKSQLTKDIATISVRLAESKHNYSMLQKENERYKNDMNLAIQLLQCKPDNFVSQKLDNLPVDTQARVSQYVMSKTAKSAGSTQSKNGNDIDTFDASEYEFNISASLMSKILEDSIQDSVTKHCDTCSCSKSQNKPFCYNESYYTVSTQTVLSGEIKNNLCLNCNAEIKSMHSGLSIRSHSPPGIRLVNDRMSHSPLYIMPQNSLPEQEETQEHLVENNKPNNVINDMIKSEDKLKLNKDVQREVMLNVEDDFKLRKNSVNMEPSVHHKLCDRTKTSISSKKSSIHSVGNDMLRDVPNYKEIKPKTPILQVENVNERKNSHSSMGAASRTSSIAKSTVSTHKSNTQVGPGPRFCHLRMQAGSKNILLDNAEPDVPPVLYRRQSKCNENSIFKDLNDGLDNFIDLDKNDDDAKSDIIKNDNVVVESTLIDVHVDNNNKEASMSVKSNPINPVLLNVSSSPLQPLKTHNFSNNSEYNNNSQLGSQHNAAEIDNLLNDFNGDSNNTQNNTDLTIDISNKIDVASPNENQEIKIFNFDRYEQSKANQYKRPLKKIDMSQLHSIESTKISKDFPPVGVEDDENKRAETVKPTLPNIVNVYPNLTQTHLKVNESKKVFTNEQSTSSLSSDDSAALLQKQQLLRVAEWVEKNLEQQNNLNDPLEDECSFTTRAMRRDSKINRLTETLNELALNMPHPVSKYSKMYTREPRNNWPNNVVTSQNMNQDKATKQSDSNPKIINNIVKETIFPVECGDETVTEINDNSKVYSRGGIADIDVRKELRDALKNKGEKEISPEDLARMEYNVKKFLLSGPHWVNSGSGGRSRRTSSKTETDV
ncbi:GATA zinc finger domain-containing protein 14 isoform X1 [Maniola jurtina]|uniref:GATA zinc finger domain-containing protein 14 isoform X1 n=3 Tax=Maniola jurtina TaxID=191418 RepID=UPI001E68630A|nr:GATA zinc finger domain-containing protein 14 isoform X1 [Maniola jurtina]